MSAEDGGDADRGTGQKLEAFDTLLVYFFPEIILNCLQEQINQHRERVSLPKK